MTGPRWLAHAAVVVLISVGAARPAAAQAPARDFGWEVSGGVTWTRGFAIATAAGIEGQANGNAFPLFTTDTRLDSAVGGHVAFARRLVGPLGIEADGALDRTVYRTRVTADFENASLVSATNAATTYSFGGSLVATFARHRRLQPFFRVGIGERRELSADRTLSGDGHVLVFGGGVTYWIGGPATGRFGLRVEADGVGRSGGLLLGDATRFAPGLRAGCSLRF